jgi:SAM-dependent methyltransferase
MTRLFRFGWHRASRFIRLAASQGLVKTLKPYIRMLALTREPSAKGMSFDQAWGVDTEGSIHLLKLDINSRNAIHGARYQPTPLEPCERLVSGLKLQHEEFIFIDLGSGKGRVLLLASTFPFKKVIGIEFSPELVCTAQDNIRKCEERMKCQDVEVLCMDAVDYEFPAEKTVLYLYNPFDEVVGERVVNKLRLSLVEFPRDLYVIYYNPAYSRIFDRQSWLRPIGHFEGASIYRSVT